MKARKLARGISVLFAAFAAPLACAQAIDHSGTDHSLMAPADAPPAGDHSDYSDHSGHAMHASPAMDGMAMSPADHEAMTMAPTEPRTPIPPLSDADRAAARPPGHLHRMADNAIHSYSLINRLEAWDADPGTGLAWEGQGWIGTDLNRLWWRSEGERERGATQAAELELLYGHSISVWWDVVGGVRHDFKPGDGLSFAAIGVQGLAPQNFEVQAMAYLGERGQSAARLEVEYELLLSNRLILQPLLEARLYGKNDASRGIGAGLSSSEAGLRLRYEFTRQFAPYVGVVHERAYGNTAEQRRARSEHRADTRLMLGLRSWF